MTSTPVVFAAATVVAGTAGAVTGGNVEVLIPGTCGGYEYTSGAVTARDPAGGTGDVIECS
jgi:hypothetical protein